MKEPKENHEGDEVTRTLEIETFDPSRERPFDHDDKLIGRILARKYAIVETLGTTETTKTYRALTLETNQQVVVKTLVFNSPEIVSLFKQRTRFLTGKKIHFAVETIDYFETPDGRPFWVTDFIPGITLDELLKKNDYIEDEHEISELLSMIARALVAAHKQGIFHGNLYAHNVFLFEQDNGITVRVSDFGMGSLLLRRSAINPSAEADVFQLGVLSYHLITGKLPFKAKDYSEILLSQGGLRDNTELLAYHRSDLYCVDELSELIEESLDLDVAYRLENVTSFIDGIKNWLHRVEGAQLKRSQVVDEIADGIESRQARVPTAERNMRTTVRNMVNLRLNLSNQEETLLLKFADKAAVRGPRLSPLATATRLAGIGICIVILCFSIHYVVTTSSIHEIWLAASRQLSLVFHNKEPRSETGNEVQPAAPPKVAGNASPARRLLVPAFVEPTPRADPQLIRSLYAMSKSSFGGNNSNDTKSRGFRIDYRQFNNEWIDR